MLLLRPTTANKPTMNQFDTLLDEVRVEGSSPAYRPSAGVVVLPCHAQEEGDGGMGGCPSPSASASQQVTTGDRTCPQLGASQPVDLSEQVADRRHNNPGRPKGPATPKSDSINESHGGVNGFFNPRQPSVALQSENPAQRMVLIKKMQGLTNREIAEVTGYTPEHVATICKQPWALEYMARSLHEQGVDKVAKLIDQNVAKAVERIIVEMDNEDARSQERTNAAKALIEMKYGKAVQVIEHRDSQSVTEMTDLEIANRLAELASLASN